MPHAQLYHILAYAVLYAVVTIVLAIPPWYYNLGVSFWTTTVMRMFLIGVYDNSVNILTVVCDIVFAAHFLFIFYLNISRFIDWFVGTGSQETISDTARTVNINGQLS